MRPDNLLSYGTAYISHAPQIVKRARPKWCSKSTITLFLSNTHLCQFCRLEYILPQSSLYLQVHIQLNKTTVTLHCFFIIFNKPPSNLHLLQNVILSNRTIITYSWRHYRQHSTNVLQLSCICLSIFKDGRKHYSVYYYHYFHAPPHKPLQPDPLTVAQRQ